MARFKFEEGEILAKLGKDGVDAVMLLRHVNGAAASGMKRTCKSLGQQAGYTQHQVARYCKLLKEKADIDLVKILHGDKVGRNGGRKRDVDKAMEIIPPERAGVTQHTGLAVVTSDGPDITSYKNIAIDKAMKALDELKEALSQLKD